MATIYVRRIANREEVVHSFEVPSPAYHRTHERMMVGLLRNLRTDCFVDDSEVELYDFEGRPVGRTE